MANLEHTCEITTSMENIIVIVPEILEENEGFLNFSICIQDLEGSIEVVDSCVFNWAK